MQDKCQIADMGYAFSVLSTTALTQPAFPQEPLFNILGTLISMDPFTYTELNWKVTGVTLFSALEDEKVKVLEKKKIEAHDHFLVQLYCWKSITFFDCMMLERGEKNLNSWQENIFGTMQEWIYTQMCSMSFLIIYLESGLISTFFVFVFVCMSLYVYKHS